MVARSQQNQINHVALVLDASSSMTHHAAQLVKVVEDQIAYLARRSKELDQETRVSVYSFANTVECVIYDKDVLRMPSIRDYYRPSGMTALVDAVVQSQEDLGRVWEGYGEHSFLTFVLTDGQENASGNGRESIAALSNRISTLLKNLPDHWTVGVLVPPGPNYTHEAKQFGFPAQNISVWDTSSSAGLDEAATTIQRATENFMQARKAGIRGTKNLFAIGEELTGDDVKSALQPMPPSSYRLIPVPSSIAIRPFVKDEAGLPWSTGCAMYQLTKRETIQGTKEVAVVEKATDKVYIGDAARQVIGLPDVTTVVKPGDNPDYDIYVQSTSVNRKLIAGTRVLVKV